MPTHATNTALGVANAALLKALSSQERERSLCRCRRRAYTALKQRSTCGKQRGVWVRRSQQAAELTALRAELADSGNIHSQVVQDVLARLEKT